MVQVIMDTPPALHWVPEASGDETANEWAGVFHAKEVHALGRNEAVREPFLAVGQPAHPQPRRRRADLDEFAVTRDGGFDMEPGH